MRRYLVAGACLLALSTAPSPAGAKGPADAYHGRGTANVMWFMHISDLHIGASTIEDPEQAATPNLQFALGQATAVFKPSFVLATGDLCDGSAGVIPTVGQQQDEWDAYKGIYSAAGMTPDFYFDLPGNHDAYGEDNGLTHFLASSLQGSTNKVPYVSFTASMPDGEVVFLGLNTEGTGQQPFSNPPGQLTDDELDHMEKTMTDHAAARLVVGAGHHPLNDMNNNARLRAIYDKAGGGYYLHGHVHAYEEYLDFDDTVVVNQVKSLGKDKDHNVGIVAIDHLGMAYRATGLDGTWPFVMVTAPMASDLRDGGKNPYAYPVCKDRKDNPVRALVFSDQKPTTVTAQVGTSPSAVMTAAAPDSPLYEGLVDTTSLKAGPQEVTVTAEIGSKLVFQVLTAEFADGPCDALPVDPAAGGSGGSAGSAGAAGQAGQAGAAGGAGEGGAGGASGKGGSAGAGKGGAGGLAADAGADANGGGAGQVTPEDDATTDDGGCSCHAAGDRPAGAAAWLLVAGALASLSRKGRRRGAYSQ